MPLPAGSFWPGLKPIKHTENKAADVSGDTSAACFVSACGEKTLDEIFLLRYTSMRSIKKWSEYTEQSFSNCLID